jgi:hypothetical protein
MLRDQCSYTIEDHCRYLKGKLNWDSLKEQWEYGVAQRAFLDIVNGDSGKLIKMIELTGVPPEAAPNFFELYGAPAPKSKAPPQGTAEVNIAGDYLHGGHRIRISDEGELYEGFDMNESSGGQSRTVIIQLKKWSFLRGNTLAWSGEMYYKSAYDAPEKNRKWYKCEAEYMQGEGDSPYSLWLYYYSKSWRYFSGWKLKKVPEPTRGGGTVQQRRETAPDLSGSYQNGSVIVTRVGSKYTGVRITDGRRETIFELVTTPQYTSSGSMKWKGLYLYEDPYHPERGKRWEECDATYVSVNNGAEYWLVIKTVRVSGGGDTFIRSRTR